jgi:plastocyanin
MKNNTIIILIGVVALLLLCGGLYFMSMSQQGKTPGSEIMEKKTEGGAVVEEETTEEKDMVSDQNTKNFIVTGTNFAFDVTEMRVKKGDTVVVTFVNSEGFHDWVLDEFNVRTSQLQPGEEETITFVADKVGEFEYYCSVGQHRAQGMVGKLIVEE